MKIILTTLLAVFYLTVSSEGACPAKNVRTYTTLDASVLTNIAYISEFELECKEPEQLYAEVNGKFIQVVKGERLQLSWTEELAKATRGDHLIRLYDEEGFGLLRKRSTESVTPLTTLTLNHPGSYSGPWLSSEHLAAIIGVVVVYLAITSRSKLLS